MALGIIAGLGSWVGKKIKQGVDNDWERMRNLGKRGTGIGTGMGISKWSKKKQLEQQQKMYEQQLPQARELQNMQIEGQKEMGQFNQGLAIDAWEKTASPQAQVKNMKNAGLNVGLMYGGAGGGGGATTSGAGGVGMATAPQAQETDLGMAAELGLEAEKVDAAVKVANSIANLNNTRAKKEGGIDTDLATQALENLKKDETIKEAQKVLLDLEAEWKKIQNGYAERTAEENLKLLQTANNKAIEEYQILARENKWSEETYKERVRKVTLENQMLGVQLEAQKAGIKLTEAQTQAAYKAMERVNAEMLNWSVQRQQEWDKLGIQDRQAQAQKMMAEAMKEQAEFQTGVGAELLRGSQIFGNIVGGVTGLSKLK